MKRRDFVLGATALAGAGLLHPVRTLATTTLAGQNARIDMVSDGHLLLPGDFVTAGLDMSDMPELVASYGLDADEYTPPCNLTLLRDGTRTVLFDVGAGGDFMDTTGRLPDTLEAMGLSPDEITHLVLTHAHPDHLWGLLDDFDEPFLPNAEIMIGQAEWEYWTDPATIGAIGAARQFFAIGAARRLAEISGNVTLIQPGQEILPGVSALDLAGHSPGHLGFVLDLGEQQAVVVGDALANPHLAFERPELHSGSDQDPAMAAQTRLALLDRITADDLQILGFHLPETGIGQAEQLGGGRYKFHAA
jgi:glyoxylase-like metal-dependent hydrolase (beta-lactamase superfamily II)